MQYHVAEGWEKGQKQRKGVNIWCIIKLVFTKYDWLLGPPLKKLHELYFRTVHLGKKGRLLIHHLPLIKVLAQGTLTLSLFRFYICGLWTVSTRKPFGGRWGTQHGNEGRGDQVLQNSPKLCRKGWGSMDVWNKRQRRTSSEMVLKSYLV